MIIFLFSCKKEESVQAPEDTNNWLINHYAYFKGIVTDSISGQPITGYYIETNGVNQIRDTLEDGSYSSYAYWFEGKVSLPKPEVVFVRLLNSSDSIVKIMSFDGNLLVENDTIIVNFQVTL